MGYNGCVHLPAQSPSFHLDDQYLSPSVYVIPGGVIATSRGTGGGHREVLDQPVDAEIDGLVSELLSGAVAVEVKLARPKAIDRAIGLENQFSRTVG